MAHVLKLKYGSPASWSYIDLTDSDHGIVNYVPGTPADGAETITESGRFRVSGSVYAYFIARIQAIQRVFYQALAYSQDEIGAYQVWLTITPAGAGDVWESQIFEGRLELTEQILGVDWANYATEVVLIWTRAGWWEQYADIPITNNNSSGDPLSTTIYNSGDGSGAAPTKRENWVTIEPAYIRGDLPAAATVEFTKTNAVTQFEVFHNARTMWSSSFLVEGETGTGDTVDANRSGGKYHIYTTPVGGTTGIDVQGAPADLKNITDGAWLRFSLSAYFSGTVSARPYISIGGKKYYGSKSVLTGAAVFRVYDLGMVRMPQGTFDAFTSGYYAVYVGINFIAASAVDVLVDYFYSQPIDSYAKGIMDIATSGQVTLDTRSGTMVGDDGTHADKIGAFGTLYGGIWLEPNVYQRLMFKMTEGGVDVMANSAVVNVYARMRKRTL
jgi:hypothetical protein